MGGLLRILLCFVFLSLPPSWGSAIFPSALDYTVFNKDCLSGYYRKDNEHVLVEQTPPFLSEEDSGGLDRGGKHTGGLAKHEGISAPPSRVDLKTQMAISIALLVARIPHSPTLVEQLLVQRRAANLLRTHGMQIGPQDEQTLRDLIEESVQQKESLSPDTRCTP
jgi:hypothetical protein